MGEYSVFLPGEMVTMEKSGALRQKMLVLSIGMAILGILFGIGGILSFAQRYAYDRYDPLNDDDTYLTYVGITLLSGAVTITPTWLIILRGVLNQDPSLIPTGMCLCCFVGFLCQSTVTSYREALREDLGLGDKA